MDVMTRFISLDSLGSLGSLLATVVFLRAVLSDYFPNQAFSYLGSYIEQRFASLWTHLLVEEVTNGFSDPLFRTFRAYFLSRFSDSSPLLRLSKQVNSKIHSLSLNEYNSLDTAFEDEFEGVRIRWSVLVKETPGNSREHRCLKLSFRSKFKDLVRESYLPHVEDVGQALLEREKSRKLYANKMGSGWSSVTFDHPSTFETLAIDPHLKTRILNDLDKFVDGREFYDRIGKTWKRGYLLYGPPGTGKTSLIAAIANHLDYDIYDLELSSVLSNTELRSLLQETSARSVIVIEDIDCSVQLSNRTAGSERLAKPLAEGEGTGSAEGSAEGPRAGLAEGPAKTFGVSLSGVLNFSDGLWSSCGGERIVIFTTNYKERLDPALLRPGRMDFHIHLSYCGGKAFRVLARNYLGEGLDSESLVGDRVERERLMGNGLEREKVTGDGLEILERERLMEEIDGLLERVKATPADLAEVLMGREEEGGAFEALQEVVVMLRNRLVVDQSERL